MVKRVQVLIKENTELLWRKNQPFDTRVRRDIYSSWKPWLGIKFVKDWQVTLFQMTVLKLRPGQGLGGSRCENREPPVPKLGEIDTPSIREALELTFWGNEGFWSEAKRNGKNRNFLVRRLWKWTRIWPVYLWQLGPNRFLSRAQDLKLSASVLTIVK